MKWLAGALLGLSLPASALTFHCRYDVESDRTSVGAPAGTPPLWEVTVVVANGKALLVGDAGRGNVEIVTGPGLITFIHRKQYGPVDVLAIADNGKSVLTSQSATFGPYFASILYGSCTRQP